MDNLDDLIWAFSDVQGSSAYSMDPQRPYDGQPHTDNGIRGQTFVTGLTMRDISDCFVIGMLHAGGIYRDNPIQDDVYKIDLANFDPIAATQCALCEIERRMGIYPNVPKLKLQEPPNDH